MSDSSSVSRREAMKKTAAGAAAAGLVWSAPRIEGKTAGSFSVTPRAPFQAGFNRWVYTFDHNSTLPTNGQGVNLTGGISCA